MNFSQVCQEVMSVVKRPDKLPDIRREVNAAILHFCTDQNWAYDRAESAIPINSAEYTQAVALSSLTRFRKVWYIKRGGTKDYLRKTNTVELFANRCTDTRDTWYQVGTNINVSLKALASTLDIGYYQFPPLLTDASGSFWMLDHLPYMVIDRVISKIFVDIGNNDEANIHEARALAAYASARMDFGVPVNA